MRARLGPERARCKSGRSIVAATCSPAAAPLQLAASTAICEVSAGRACSLRFQWNSAESSTRHQLIIFLLLVPQRIVKDCTIFKLGPKRKGCGGGREERKWEWRCPSEWNRGGREWS
ncbi:uncharacterized protein si:ch211-222l21.1 isoform X2 [Mobula hypostoma]|uniref:uncharacterized protein si:ch211-222l21.1 isoform X2 n=1 Tax=Mobula hypostoma TaxID=723540 RepID=UPI002FC28B4D